MDFLQCSQLSGKIPRPPKRGMAADAGAEDFYTIFIDKRKARPSAATACYRSPSCPRQLPLRVVTMRAI